MGVLLVTSYREGGAHGGGDGGVDTGAIIVLKLIHQKTLYLDCAF